MNINDVEWLDDKGFAIAREYQCDGSKGELCLVRLIIDKGEIIHGNYYMSSKYKGKLLKRYQIELTDKKNEVIMEIMETLKGLTIKQLESLKPSYYNMAIDLKIAELQAKKEVKEKNANSKVKRSTKTTTTKRNRSRNLQKKSV